MLTLLVLLKAIPHATGLICAGFLSAFAATGSSNSVTIAIIGGVFLVLNTVVTIVLQKILNESSHRKKNRRHPSRQSDNRARRDPDRDRASTKRESDSKEG